MEARPRDHWPPRRVESLPNVTTSPVYLADDLSAGLATFTGRHGPNIVRGRGTGCSEAPGMHERDRFG